MMEVYECWECGLKFASAASMCDRTGRCWTCEQIADDKRDEGWDDDRETDETADE